MYEYALPVTRDRGEVGGDRSMTESEELKNNLDFSNPVSIPTNCDESTFWLELDTLAPRRLLMPSLKS